MVEKSVYIRNSMLSSNITCASYKHKNTKFIKILSYVFKIWFNGGLDSVMLMVGLNEFKSLFQPE